MPPPPSYFSGTSQHPFGQRTSLPSLVKFSAGRSYNQPLRPSYQCSKCDYQTSAYSSYALHIMRHDGKYPYNCPYDCTYGTSSSRRIKEHLGKHTGKVGYICLHCRKEFGKLSDLKGHLEECGEKSEKGDSDVIADGSNQGNSWVIGLSAPSQSVTSDSRDSLANPVFPDTVDSVQSATMGGTCTNLSSSPGEALCSGGQMQPRLPIEKTMRTMSSILQQEQKDQN